jgi:hypothetical protein
VPLNDYTCSRCGEVFVDVLAKDEMEAMTKIMWKQCPQQSEPGCANKSACPIERKLSTANFGDPFKMGHIKTDPGFREQLQRIKKANPGSTIQ